MIRHFSFLLRPSPKYVFNNKPAEYCLQKRYSSGQNEKWKMANGKWQLKPPRTDQSTTDLNYA
jgi:hypothetical protein